LFVVLPLHSSVVENGPGVINENFMNVVDFRHLGFDVLDVVFDVLNVVFDVLNVVFDVLDVLVDVLDVLVDVLDVLVVWLGISGISGVSGSLCTSLSTYAIDFRADNKWG